MRIHTPSNGAIFDYPGTIFGQEDLLPENESLLESKLRAAAIFLLWVQKSESALPERYDEAEITHASEAIRADVTDRLQRFSPPAEDPHDAALHSHLQRLQQDFPELHDWLRRRDIDLAFTHSTVQYRPGPTGDAAVEAESYAGLWPSYPQFARLRAGGGSKMDYGRYLSAYPEETVPDLPETLYASGIRDPYPLLVHEAIGHPLFNAMQRRDEGFADRWNGAMIADGIAIDGWQPDMRPPLARLDEWIASLEDTDPRQEAARDLRQALQHTLGPESWIWQQPVYREQGLIGEEAAAALFELYAVHAAGPEGRAMLRLALPGTTEAMDHMIEQVCRPAEPVVSVSAGASPASGGWREYIQSRPSPERHHGV